MVDEIISRDQNFVTVLAGIENDSDGFIRMLRVDPITKRLLVNATGLSITGLIEAGTNITITGDGTELSPYVINSSGGGGSQTPWTSDINGDGYKLRNIAGLYNNAGTPVKIFDVNNGYLNDQSGNAMVNFNSASTGVDFPYDIGATYGNKSISPNSRYLLDTAGALNLDWSAPGIVSVVGDIKANRLQIGTGSFGPYTQNHIIGTTVIGTDFSDWAQIGWSSGLVVNSNTPSKKLFRLNSNYDGNGLDWFSNGYNGAPLDGFQGSNSANPATDTYIPFCLQPFGEGVVVGGTVASDNVSKLQVIGNTRTKTITFDAMMEGNPSSQNYATVNWEQSNIWQCTFTGNANIVFIYFGNNPVSPARLQIKILSGALTGYVLFGSSITWIGPAYSSSQNGTDFVSLTWDGTNYYGTWSSS